MEMKTEKTKMSMKEKKAWATRMLGYLQGYIFVEFTRKNAHVPELVFDSDKSCYTDGGKIIHLGLEMFDAENENDLFWQVFYVLGHELQHVHSTRERDWQYGINQQVRNACSRISRTVYGAPVKLIRRSDFDRFAEKVSQDTDIHISIQKLMQFSHFVANSLEDGRIENIRSQKYKTFPKYMKRFRGTLWQKGGIESYPEYKDLDATDRLSIKLNQVLNLATMQKFQKGFMTRYGGTPLESDIRAMIPHIRAAVASPNCRGCMEEAIKIGDMLGEDLVEASKLDAFEQLLQQLADAVMSEMERRENDSSSSDEETGDGSVSEGFGSSEFDKDDQSSDSPDDQNEGGQSSDNSDGQSENGQAEKGEQEADADSSQSGQTQSGEGDENGENNKSDEAEVAAEISDSSEMTDEQAEAQREIRRAKNTYKSASKVGIPVAKAKPEPVEYFPDIQFTEKQRTYAPDAVLPVQYNNMAKSFRREIRKILQKRKTPVMRGMRSGTVDGSQIVNLIFSDTRIFRQQKEENPADAVIYILQDNSGSMGDEPDSSRAFCCAAAAIVEEGFRGICPIKIAAFDETGYEVRHKIVKDFDESAEGVSFSWSFFKHEMSGCSNFDAYSIRVATREILARPESQKVLLVASDGLPCCPESEVKKAVDEARASGIITVGLYLSDEKAPEEFSYMYGSGCLETAPADLCTELPRVIKNAVFRK